VEERSVTTQVEAEQIQLIDLEDLEVHPSNPRKNAGDIDELAASIKEIGMLQPVVAVRHNGAYQVVAGSRRLAAAKKAGLKGIPTRVMELDEAQAAAAALIENLQRKDLDPLEEAEGYRSWLALTGKTQKELADRVARAPSTIANALRLLEAPKVVRDALARGDITAAHARVALSIPEKALALLDLRKGVSVQDLQDDARDASRAYQAVESIRRAFAKASANGMTATWPTKRIHIGGLEVDPVQVFGQPPAKIAGDIDYPGSIGGGSVAQHDEKCKCRAVGLQQYSHGQVKRVCISPSGWRAYQAASRKSVARMSGRAKKKIVTAAQKATKAKADLKKNTAEATKALAGKSMGYGQLDLGRASAFVSAASADEAQRLALFGLISKHSQAARGNAWRVELWKQIAGLAIKEVRARVLRWGVALGHREISDDYHNVRALRSLVNAHFAPKKKAKR
jgi:ParB family chromosome partitioning protein